MVVFGDHGLIAQKRLKRILYQLEGETEAIEDKNIHLSLKVRRMKSQRMQVVLQASDRLLAAPKGATIYRFRDGD